MFDILQEKDNELIIYKSVMIDAATCIVKNGDAGICAEAKASLTNMIRLMDLYFERKCKVRMQFLKNKDSESIVFTGINRFKLWLIQHQDSDAYRLILGILKDFYIKKGSPLPVINIVFGKYHAFEHEEENIYNTDVFFKNTFVGSEGWLNNELIKKAIKAVDKSDVVNENTIYSPIFGNMSPSKLSGGVKTLILIYNNPEMVFNASTCGDNCAKWIEKFAKEKDFVICLYHTMHFSEKNFKAYIVNADAVVDNYEDYIMYSDKYCREAE